LELRLGYCIECIKPGGEIKDRCEDRVNLGAGEDLVDGEAEGEEVVETTGLIHHHLTRGSLLLHQQQLPKKLGDLDSGVDWQAVLLLDIWQEIVVSDKHHLHNEAVGLVIVIMDGVRDQVQGPLQDLVPVSARRPGTKALGLVELLEDSL